MINEPKPALKAIASNLRAVHKLLLDYEKSIYEKTFGRIENPYQLLHLAMEDPQFAWLRALSGEMVHMDEVRLNRAGVTETDLRMIGTRIRALVTTDRQQTTFQEHYALAKEADPAVVIAHAELMKSLPEAPAVELFLSAGEEQDSKDPLPGAIRPGTLVPGNGDKGYFALGAIEERGLLAGVSLKSVRFANETVLGLASVPMEWTANEEQAIADAWTPVIVQAGTGASIARTPSADGVLVCLFVRQEEIGGDPSMEIKASIEENEWLLLADAEQLNNHIDVYARISPPNASLDVPTKPDHDVLIYVVAGSIEIDGVPVPDSRLALVRHPEKLVVQSTSETMFFAILVNPEARITRAGSVAR